MKNELNITKTCKCALCSHEKKLSIEQDSSPCSYRKKQTPNCLEVNVSETIKLHDSFKLRKYIPKIKDWVVERIGGWFPSRDYKGGVNKTRGVDRENDKYDEHVAVYETGEELKNVKEKLSNHQGHGSAKFKK